MGKILEFPGPKKRKRESENQRSSSKKVAEIVELAAFDESPAPVTQNNQTEEITDDEKTKMPIVDSSKIEFIRSLTNSMAISNRKIAEAKSQLNGMRTLDIIDLINNTPVNIIQTKPTYFAAALALVGAVTDMLGKEKFRNYVLKHLAKGDKSDLEEDVDE